MIMRYLIIVYLLGFSLARALDEAQMGVFFKAQNLTSEPKEKLVIDGLKQSCWSLKSGAIQCLFDLYRLGHLDFIELVWFRSEISEIRIFAYYLLSLEKVPEGSGAERNISSYLGKFHAMNKDARKKEIAWVAKHKNLLASQLPDNMRKTLQPR